ncbi:sensor domain-containing protein [Nocardia sp. NPDC006044]|uniref:sensor domain-containing protein n=1 Tax=Nocardia sp. NPDC006044 TaxID=3364306 RepID=UPI00368A3615
MGQIVTRMISLVLLGCVLVGCKVGGSATDNLTPGSIDAALIGLADASVEVGSTLMSRVDATKPVAAQPTTPPECGTGASPASEAVYGSEWTQFRLTTFQESSSTWDHSLTQAVGRYAGPEQARGAFLRLSDALVACGDRETVVIGAGGVTDSKWRNHGDVTSGEVLRWNAEQLDATTWRCFREVRLKQATLVQVALCQSGNGQPAAAAIADKLSSRL